MIDFSALKAYGTVLFFINQDIITAADNNANFAPFKGVSPGLLALASD